MHAEPTDLDTATAQEELAKLLEALVRQIPGAQWALLSTGDGLKLAFCNRSVDDADDAAAACTGIRSAARQLFKDSPGGVRQVAVEHDEGFCFVMGAGLVDEKAVGTLLTVVAGRDADPGQAGHHMVRFVTGLDEQLVVAARRNSIRRLGAPRNGIRQLEQ
ncbi:roadblock/LC7 domain-containing protein [Streptomyces chrestomyceticus]|uniref:roadblock/LC7 domain-containing protein n=1 Tax=Streptomyces chrestomyceticus TaxID=68185 RepID=UPI0033E88714